MGSPSSTNRTYEPVQVYNGDFLSGKTIVKVAAGDYFSVALSSDGKVYTWGSNVSTLQHFFIFWLGIRTTWSWW